MSALFTISSIPPGLQHVQDDLSDAALFDKGFAALGFHKGSPGYRAIETPITPVDKAFQIYAIHLAHSNNFTREPSDHSAMWLRRDAAWKAGAEWLMDTQDVYKDMDKKTTRAQAKILPEALRSQCSLELPPGPWSEFPRDSMRKTKDIDLAMDGLQHLGLNIKIHGIAILEGDTPDPKWRLQQDQGTLASMVQSVQMHKAALAAQDAADKNAAPQQLF